MGMLMTCSFICHNFRPDSGSSQYCALASIESCVSDVRAWLLHNRLLINDSRTEFFIVGSHQQLSKISIIYISVGDSIIQPRHSIPNLGSCFDSNIILVDSHCQNM